jgi:hypothetical protein
MCCAGGAAPPANCPPPPLVSFLPETPPPMMLNWWENRRTWKGVSNNAPYNSVTRLGDTNLPGFLEGSFNLPVDGRWMVKFDFFVPKYDAASSAEEIFPTESIGAVSTEDAVDCLINGNIFHKYAHKH